MATPHTAVSRAGTSRPHVLSRYQAPLRRVTPRPDLVAVAQLGHRRAGVSWARALCVLDAPATHTAHRSGPASWRPGSSSAAGRESPKLSNPPNLRAWPTRCAWADRPRPTRTSTYQDLRRRHRRRQKHDQTQCDRRRPGAGVAERERHRRRDSIDAGPAGDMSQSQHRISHIFDHPTSREPQQQ